MTQINKGIERAMERFVEIYIALFGVSVPTHVYRTTSAFLSKEMLAPQRQDNRTNGYQCIPLVIGIMQAQRLERMTVTVSNFYQWRTFQRLADNRRALSKTRRRYLTIKLDTKISK